MTNFEVNNQSLDTKLEANEIAGIENFTNKHEQEIISFFEKQLNIDNRLT